MFDLFRFIMLRPPEKVDAEDGLDVAPDGELHDELKDARNGDNPLSAMQRIAETFVAGERFVGEPQVAQHGAALNSLHEVVSESHTAHLTQMKTFVRNAFDHSAAEVIADAAFKSDKASVHDSLLSAKLAPSAVRIGSGASAAVCTNDQPRRASRRRRFNAE